jgi:DNA-binding NarL/FixJ family response regulator
MTQPVTAPILIGLLDDHQLMLDGISALLDTIPEVRIVHRSTKATELFANLQIAPVDIVLLDLYLPNPTGLDVLAEIREKHPDVQVIILSGNSEEELIHAAFRTGAQGYITKGVDREELLLAIQQVKDGERYLSQQLVGQLSTAFVKRAVHGDPAKHSGNNLSKREVEIIRGLAMGLSQKEVAHDLQISARTVEAHRANILEKLDLRTTIDLVKYAIKHRIVEL